jgi:[glutamine synthetase] adenylyltransferase / [glutamine synthetase]-adenylyl-L-tyrosine phosphorylase
MSQLLNDTSQISKFIPISNDLNFAMQKTIDLTKLYDDPESKEFARILENDQNKELLHAVFSSSPYLTQLMFKDPKLVLRMFIEPVDDLIEEIFNDLNTELLSVSDSTHLKKTVRDKKSEVALSLAFADLSGKWSLEKITNTLSKFAEMSVQLSVNYLLHQAIIDGDLNHSDLNQTVMNVGEKSGYVVLAMGKLGGRELNYSSDIDLIVLFDRDIIRYSGNKTAQSFFIKLTQNLVKIISDRTADGYVFRTDLRLRPDPGATPIALSMEGAETYYQTVGLNWERAAMIKARPIAGDIKAGYDFLQRIKGFVWRKHLDYAAIEDIHAIKTLIHKFHHHSEIKLKGFDVKLGPGGIREIEFYAQIHQLISGGRNLSLRVAPTCLALHALVQNDMLDESDNQILQNAYRYLRTLEHRLQMINDDQTHELPTDTDDILRITNFMGYRHVSEFETELTTHLKSVHALFNDLLKDTQNIEEKQDLALAFPAEQYNKKTLEAIATEGFQDPQKIYDLIQKWQLGRYRACRTDRARRILKKLIPDILKAFGSHVDPDGSFLKFDDFLSKLPSGVQLFSFINAHPWLLELLAQIMGIAPDLANQLARRPLLLDSVLNNDVFQHNSYYEVLEQNLNDQLALARDFQDVLDITRKWANECKFQVGIQILRGVEDVISCGQTLTYIADITLLAMFKQVKKEFALKHGVVEKSALSMLAMGKLGGYELTTTSDVDMILIYDSDDNTRLSTGPKQLSVNHYFARLSQNFINSITALTAEGRLYEIDMRLRPSGSKGPLAVSLQSFSDYQKGQAWIWEHMALTRGRVLGAPERLKDKIKQEIHSILTYQGRDQDILLVEVEKMRRRLTDEFPTQNIWSIKHIRGGIIDIEFICQYLILKHGPEFPTLLEKNTLLQIKKLKEIGILASEKALQLYDACYTLQTVQVLLRLCLGDSSKDDIKPPALLIALAKRLNCEVDEIEPLILKKQKYIYHLYQEIIETPAAQLGPLETVVPADNAAHS